MPSLARMSWRRRARPTKRTRPSSYYDRIVEVMEELVRFTLLARHLPGFPTDRYNKRKATVAKLDERGNLKAAT